jgi:hypothetical protein
MFRRNSGIAMSGLVLVYDLRIVREASDLKQCPQATFNPCRFTYNFIWIKSINAEMKENYHSRNITQIPPDTFPE